MIHKRIWFTALVGAVLAGGCRQVTQEQVLAEGLVTYKEITDSGDTLTGVRRMADSTVLVAPANYRSIRAEEHFLVCRKGEYSYEVFFRDTGKKLGRFDTFNRFVRESCDYYIGTSYRTYCFYFPKHNLTLRTDEAEMNVHGIRLKVDGEWQTRDFEGGELNGTQSHGETKK